MEYLQYIGAVLAGLVFGMVTGVYFVDIYKSKSTPSWKFGKFTAALTTMGGIPNSVFFFVVEEAFIFCLVPYFVFVLIPVAGTYWATMRDNYTPSDPGEFERT